MISHNSLIIAIDFDGTIVEDEYPKIGRPMVFAFETLHKLQEDGHRLILWTYRSGKKLEEAVDFCKENGIEFYAVNESYDQEILDKNTSRKINANIFVDDRNVGGFIGWGEIYLKISKNTLPINKQTNKKKGFLSIFKK
jgi:hydroxymethylpyrimidine pyrophosphatase-like HAD family hydrolase